MTSQSSKNHKHLDFYGILQPTTGDERDHSSYKLVTDTQSYFLQVPEVLNPYLKKHQWENFCVHGDLLSKDKICVKRAQMMDAESLESSGEIDSTKDMQLYEHQIHSGQTLESKDFDNP